MQLCAPCAVSTVINLKSVFLPLFLVLKGMWGAGTGGIVAGLAGAWIPQILGKAVKP